MSHLEMGGVMSSLFMVSCDLCWIWHEFLRVVPCSFTGFVHSSQNILEVSKGGQCELGMVHPRRVLDTRTRCEMSSHQQLMGMKMLQASSYQNKTPESRQMVRMPSGCFAFSPTPTPNQIPKLVLEIRSFLGPQLFHSKGGPSYIWGGEWWLALLFKLIKSSGSRIPFPSVGCLGWTHAAKGTYLKRPVQKPRAVPWPTATLHGTARPDVISKSETEARRVSGRTLTVAAVIWSVGQIVHQSIDQSTNQPKRFLLDQLTSRPTSGQMKGKTTNCQIKNRPIEQNPTILLEFHPYRTWFFHNFT